MAGKPTRDGNRVTPEHRRFEARTDLRLFATDIFADTAAQQGSNSHILGRETARRR